MRDKAFKSRLYEELPGLVADEVIDIETAKRIMDHYGPLKKSGARLVILAFSILGALFIGGGVILLIAHNWNELGRGVRAVLSFVPLAAMQALAVYMLASEERRESSAWREGVGIGWNLAVASAIALVSQTYNLGGTMEEFLFAWVFLSLPVAYVVKSSFSLAITLNFLTQWRFSAVHSATAWLFWPLLLLCLPHIIMEHRKNPTGALTALLAWVYVYAIFSGVMGTIFGGSLQNLRIGMLFTVAGGLYLFGRWLYRAQGASFGRQPLAHLGHIVLMALLFVFSYDQTWKILERETHSPAGNAYETAGVLAAFALLWLFGIWKAWERGDRQAYILGLLPPVAWGLSALALYGNAFRYVAILDNLYGFAAGVLFIYIGDREDSLVKTNMGMVLVAGLAFLRFVDSSQSIIMRALVLIAIGIAFLTVNVRLAKRPGREAK